MSVISQRIAALTAPPRPTKTLGYAVLVKDGDTFTLWGTPGNDGPYDTIADAEHRALSKLNISIPNRTAYVVEVNFVKEATK